jgi:putative heme-binding domain-containing protein
MQGQAVQGRTIFAERCASCHRLAGEGHALGPDLETVRSSGKDILLANIIDPNREVIPKYLNYLVETRDGDTLTGLVSVETQSSLVLRQANSVETTLLRSSIAALRSLGQSVMPEGLEEGLSDQALADLLEYVLNAKGTQASP